MSFIWHFLDKIVPGPGPVELLELALFWLAVFLLLRSLRPSLTYAMASVLFLMLWPFLFAHQAVVLKDVLGGNFALLGFAILFGYPNSRRPALTVTLAFVMFALAGLVRYQLWLAAIPALGVLIFYNRPSGWLQPRALRHSALSVLTMLLTIAAAQLSMSMTFDLRPRFLDIQLRQMMVFDIASVVARAPNTSLVDLAASGANATEIKRRAELEYSPYSRLPLSQPGGLEEITDRIATPTLLRQWHALVEMHPLLLLQHRSEAFLALLGAKNLYACWPLNTVGFLGQPNVMWRALGGASLHPPLAVGILKSKWFPAGTVVFRPIAYLLISLPLFVAFMRQKSGDATIAAAMIISTWIYWLSFFPAPLSCEVRYSYFPCVAVLFCTIFWAGKRFGCADLGAAQPDHAA
jgi:hypothetical protein